MLTGSTKPTYSSSEDSVSATVECTTPLASTREAIRKNWENLRSTNLQFTDFSFSQLYEADLSKSTLKGAYLHGANLRCANLADADINDAMIDDSTDTRLIDVYNTSVPATLTRAVSLSDEYWHRWKQSKFKMSALKTLLGSNFPEWAASYSENVCDGP
jgi:hypothetical protein